MAKNRKTPDMNLPVWFDGQNINEALFCEEFLRSCRNSSQNRTSTKLCFVKNFCMSAESSSQTELFLRPMVE